MTPRPRRPWSKVVSEAGISVRLYERAPRAVLYIEHRGPRLSPRWRGSSPRGRGSCVSTSATASRWRTSPRTASTGTCRPGSPARSSSGASRSPRADDPATPAGQSLADYRLKKAEGLAALPRMARGGYHAFRRLWASKRRRTHSGHTTDAS